MPRLWKESLHSRQRGKLASVRTCRCPCGGLDYSVAIGFALRDSGEVRWVTVALRCTACGILGSFADWGIDYTSSTQLLDRC